MSNSIRTLRGIAVSLLVATLFAAAPVAGQGTCVGDCSANNAVAINEVILCVAIGLGNRPVADCNSCDSNDNGLVAINELIQAVGAALNGCSPGVSTPTPPQATDTPGGPTSTATATPTPAADIENVSGASAAIANAVASIPNVLGAVLAGVSATQSAQFALNGIPGGGAGNVDPCELGGTVTETSDLPNLELVLDDCRVSRPGGSALFDGTLNVTITQFLPPPLGGTASFEADITFFDDAGQVLTTTAASLASPIRLAVAAAPGNPCAIDVSVLGEVRITRLDLTRLTGDLVSQVPAQGTSSVTWNDTDVSVAVRALSEDCVPVDFDVTVNGDATINYQGPSAAPATASGGVFAVVFDVTFDDFVVAATGDGNASEVEISGDLTSSCLGETVTLSTPESLSFLLGQFCPSGGTLHVEDIGDIVYSPAGVSVNGKSFELCVDPELLQCL